MRKINLIVLILFAVSLDGLVEQQRIKGGIAINITETPWQMRLKFGNVYD